MLELFQKRSRKPLPTGNPAGSGFEEFYRSPSPGRRQRVPAGSHGRAAQREVRKLSGRLKSGGPYGAVFNRENSSFRFNRS